jgi:hypothetical protein
MVEDKDGVMVFQLAQEFELGRDEALTLADELPGAAADHNTAGAHAG